MSNQVTATRAKQAKQTTTLTRRTTAWSTLAAAVAATLVGSGPTARAVDVTWDGPSAGSWNVGTNWSGDVVPSNSSYNVTIPNNYSVTLNRPGTTEVGNLTLAAPNGTLNLLSGSNLTVLGTLTTGGSVVATGATFTAAGAVAGNGSAWRAESGGVISIAGLTSYSNNQDYATRRFTARNAGSRISASNVTSLSISGTSAALNLEADSGGVVDLRSVGSVSLGQYNYLTIDADGPGSTINLSALATLPTNGVTIDLGNGATLLWNNPATLRAAQFTVTGTGVTVNTSNLSNVNDSSFRALAGAQYALPALTTFTLTDDYTTNTFLADGANSRLRATNLTTLNVVDYSGEIELVAKAGGRVDATKLTTVNLTPTGRFELHADGAGSTVDVSLLSALPTNGVTVDLRNGGTVLWNNPTALKNGILSFTGGGNTLAVGALANVDGTSLSAESGAALTLGAVTTVASVVTSATDQWVADGANSRVSLTNLATANVSADYGHLEVIARVGGYVDLKNLTAASATGTSGEFELRAQSGGTVDARKLTAVTLGSSGTFLVYADGAGSTVNLSALATLPTNGVSIDLRNGGGVLWANPTALKDGSISFTGAGNSLNVSALANVDASHLYAESGGTLSLPAVTAYTHTRTGTREIQSEGAGSTIGLTNVAALGIQNDYATLRVAAATSGKVDLRNATTATLTGQSTHLDVRADTGGQVDLRNLTAVNLAPAARLTLYANGAGSLINASALTTLPTNGVTIDLRNGGTLQWGNPTALRNGTISFTGPGNVLNVAALSNVDGGYLDAAAGATLSLPAVTSYAVRGTSTGRDWLADQAGTVIALTNLASIQITDAYSRLHAKADRTAKIDLRNLTTAQIQSANGSLRFLAEEGGIIDLSKLTTLTPAAAGGGGSFEFHGWGAGSVINASSLATLPSDAVTIDLEGGASLLWNNPTTMKGGKLTLTGAGNTIALAGLTNVDRSDFTASTGAVLTLANVAAYQLDGGTTSSLWWAERAGSRINMTNLASLDVSGAYSHWDVIAEAGGVVDLKSLARVTRADATSTTKFAARGTNSLIDASALQSGFRYGLALPGTPAAAGLTAITATNGGQITVRELGNLPELTIGGPTSRVTVLGTIDTPANGQVAVTNYGTLAVKRDFLFRGSNEATVTAAAGVLALDGTGLQRVEIGGTDAGGTLSNLANDNFGVGRLVVGASSGPATIAELRDDLNNGNRNGSAGANEALYLYGARGRTTAPQGADGPTLELLNGSTLLIGDKNVYVRTVNGVTNLQSLFTGGTRMVNYGGGYVSKSFSAVPGAWNVAGGGSFGAAGNWLVSAPGGAGTAAVFGDKVTTAATVTVDAPVTVGLLGFDGPGSYTINGGQAITIANANNLRGGVHVRGSAGAAGNHVVNAPVTLGHDLDLVSHSAGLLTIAGPLNNPGGRFLTKLGAGTIVLSGPQTHAAGAQVTAGEGTLRLDSNVGHAAAATNAALRTATLRAQATGNLHVTANQYVQKVDAVGGKITVAALPGQTGRPVVVTSELSIGSGGLITFGRGGMVIDYAPGGPSPAALVRAALRSGYDGPAGPWTGSTGIRSEFGAGGAEIGVGYAEASRVLGPTGGTFFGVPVDATAVLLRYTRSGDANLDGFVDFNDLVVLAQNYETGTGGAPLGWDKADFNYDGYTDFIDLVSLAQNYERPADPDGALPAAASPAFAAAWADAVAGAAVPEPTALATIALAATATLTRRRRRPARA
jgi:autotransporter-associated beta strand protein